MSAARSAHDARLPVTQEDGSLGQASTFLQKGDVLAPSINKGEIQAYRPPN